MCRDLREMLDQYGACGDALEWAEDHDDAEIAWNECQRGDWLLWIAAKVGVRRQLIALAACKCARLSLKYVKAGEDRPLKAIETTEAWVRGEATIEEVRAARDAASAYASAAASAAAYAAAYAAADADAYAAAAADAAAAAATYAAAYAAADADAYAAAAADARKSTLAKCADLVRETIPFSTIQPLIPKEEPAHV